MDSSREGDNEGVRIAGEMAELNPLTNSSHGHGEYHLSTVGQIAIAIYVTFLLLIGLVANSVVLILKKQNPRLRRSATSIVLTYITVVNLLHCCLLNAFSYIALSDSPTGKSTNYCKLYAVFGSIFMKLAAFGPLGGSILGTLEIVRPDLSQDKRRLKRGVMISLVICTVAVVAGSVPLYMYIEITANPSCFIIYDGKEIFIKAWKIESVILIFLPVISSITSLVIIVKKIRTSRAKVSSQVGRMFQPSSVDAVAKISNGGSIGETEAGLTRMGDTRFSRNQENDLTTDNPQRKNSAMVAKNSKDVRPPKEGAALKKQPNRMAEEVRLIRLTFFLCLALLVSWIPAAVFSGNTVMTRDSALPFIMIRVAYFTTVYPAAIPLIFLYNNKHFQGGFLGFFKRLTGM